MARITTFFEFSPTTKARWERLARRAAAMALYESDGDGAHIWRKSEIVEHIRRIFADDGEELDGRREGMYLERMRMASVFSGPQDPTLDLVPSESNGFGYRWIRDGQIPAGFLGHILAIADAMPRLAFDYFVLLSREYTLEELVDAISPAKAMLLLLLAELYVRVKRIDDLNEDLRAQYLQRIEGFKQEVQTKITRAEASGFNAMAGGLLLGVSPTPE